MGRKFLTGEHFLFNNEKRFINRIIIVYEVGGTVINADLAACLPNHTT